MVPENHWEYYSLCACWHWRTFLARVSYRFFFCSIGTPLHSFYKCMYIHTALGPMDSSYNHMRKCKRKYKNSPKGQLYLIKLHKVSKYSKPRFPVLFSFRSLTWAACHLATTPACHHCNAPDFNIAPKNLVDTIPLTKALETLSCEFLF